MSNLTELRAQSIARRKEILLVQGAIYRADLISAKAAIETRLRTESLFKSLLRTTAAASFSALKSRVGQPGFGVQAVLPLLISGLAALSKKVRLRPLVRGVLLAGTVGVVVGLAVKRRRAKEADRFQGGR